MLKMSQRPSTPEMRYPMTPSAGNPNKKGPIPVVIIIEEPIIIAAIMMPKVKRLVILSRVFRRPARFSSEKPPGWSGVKVGLRTSSADSGAMEPAGRRMTCQRQALKTKMISTSKH